MNFVINGPHHPVPPTFARTRSTDPPAPPTCPPFCFLSFFFSFLFFTIHIPHIHLAYPLPRNAWAARQVHPISKLIWQCYYYYYNKNSDKKAGQISLVLDLFIFCWVGRQIWFRSFIRCEMRFLKSIKRNATRIFYSGNKRIFPSFQERKRKKIKTSRMKNRSFLFKKEKKKT